MIVMSSALPTSAYSIGAPEVYGFRATNAAINGIDYHDDTRILTVVVSSVSSSWFNIGLTYVEVAFNRNCTQTGIRSARLISDDPVLNSTGMLKNYTTVEEAVIVSWYRNGTLEQSRLCFYLGVFLYLFPNHTIINERSMLGYVMWGRIVFREGEVPSSEPHFTTPPRPLVSSSYDTNDTLHANGERYTVVVDVSLSPLSTTDNAVSYTHLTLPTN